MDFSKPQKYSSTLTVKEKVSSKVYKTIYTLKDAQTVSFVAGQTVMLYCGDVNRPMTIASPPQESSAITIYQDVSPMGKGSQWLLARNVGDTVDFMAPLGRFVLGDDEGRKRIFVATGTGIAPFWSMVRDTSGQWKKNGDVSLYFGLRYPDDIFLVDEIKNFCQKNPELRFHFVLSKASDGWTGLKGHVTDHVFANEADIVSKEFYLCGGKPMIKEMQEKLSAVGVPADHIKFDPFF